MKSEPNITRLDYGRTRGWWVRIYRTEGGVKECTSKSFSDGKHGGKRKALAAARAWRDAQEKMLGPRMRGGGSIPVGAGYVKRVNVSRRKTVSPAFVAWLKSPSGPKSTSRSIAVWGVAGAKRECETWLRAERAKLRP